MRILPESDQYVVCRMWQRKNTTYHIPYTTYSKILPLLPILYRQTLAALTATPCKNLAAVVGFTALEETVLAQTPTPSKLIEHCRGILRHELG